MKKIITAILVAVATFTPFAVEAAPNPFSTVTGGLNIPGLTASQCIATDANKNLVSTGAACGTGSVTAVTGSGNISSSGGATPNITISATPSFTSVTASGAVSGGTLLGTGLTSGDCVQAGSGGLLTTTATACSTGVVQSVTGGTNITVTGTTANPVVNTVAAPSFSGTVTAGQVIDSGLTASQGVSTNASSQLISSGEASPTTYINGARAGGLHIETKQLTPSSSTPWEATMTFASAYTTAPLCTATIINSTPLYAGATIVSESTTAAVIFDSSQQGYTYNVICIGY